MSRKIEDLRPECQEAARDTLTAWQTDGELKALGVSGVIITETKRELAVQMAYFSRGRMAPEHVRMMYDAAGIKQTLSDKETQISITWTLKSKHIAGLAFDVVPLNEQGKPWWDAPMRIWMRVGAIAEQYGWEWGGRWEQKDLPHFQWGRGV